MIGNMNNHREGLDLSQFNEKNLCIIEARERIHFKFDVQENEEPFFMALITPGTCTINSNSCRYELWTSNMNNSIPFNHLIDTKTPYLSVERKRRRSSVGSSNPEITSASFTKLVSMSKKKTVSVETKPKEEIQQTLFSVMELENMLNELNLGRLNQYGSIFDYFKEEKIISHIKSVKHEIHTFYDHHPQDEEEEEVNNNGILPPLFYFNDSILLLKRTCSTDDNEQSLLAKHTLYYGDKPLTNIDINIKDGIIAFSPIYYNDRVPIELISY
jgi:hypothetical protein